MSNARDLPEDLGSKKILALGPAGSGKTTQFLSLPGKKFLYIFDPNSLQSLKGYDVEYEMFLPDAITMGVVSLNLSKGGDKPQAIPRSTAYLEWENDYARRKDTGFFKEVDWIGVDSVTSLLDLIMDRVQTINGRAGQWPVMDDWASQMLAFIKLVRDMTSLGCGLYYTGHLKTDKDEALGRFITEPLLTGQLRQKLPLLFTDIFEFEASSDGKKEAEYIIHTVPTRLNKTIRCSIKGWDRKQQKVVKLDPIEDVTLNFNEPLEGQGLGGILNWERRYFQGVREAA